MSLFGVCEEGFLLKSVDQTPDPRILLNVQIKHVVWSLVE